MSEIVTVKVVQGQLRGREATTKSGHTYYSFQGIPYAKPPVGALRFKAPQPAEPWEGMRDALVEGPVCAQIDILKKAFKGEEDCLFLNVYTPKLPKSPGYKPMAVMVWLHGGGFAIGDGNSWLYGPDFLVTEGIVLVTLNYRLGPLGFLCLEDNVIPGNAGLKDQVMALRWVQQNISKFGGDAHNVTLFGVSSGASCIHYLMLSPMAAGLFHRAIIQSGSALNPWAFDEAPREKAFRLGAALGCHTQDSVELAEYLRSVPIQRLVECIEKSKPKGWHPKRRGLCNFAPSVECGIAEDEETFLDEHPIALMKHGRFHKVPLIIGVTSHEGLLFLKEIMTVPSQLEFYNKNFESVICKLFYSGISENKWKEIAEKVKKFYFGDKPLCQDTLLEYVDLNTDVQFVTPICFFVKMVLEHTPFPVYCYKFSFDGRLAYLKQLLGLKQFPGVCHSDEIGYLFRVGHMDHELDPDSPEARARQRMVRMWSNFAKMGRPIPKRDFLLNTLWEPIVLEDLQYLNIDTDITMQREIHKGHLQFWEELMYNNL